MRIFVNTKQSDDMQKKLKFILGVLSCVTVVQSPAQETSLWYDAPADEWMKSLPVGNGRVGAMVFVVR